MNLDQAKQILLLYRPGTDEIDPETAEALELAKQIPELGRWFEQQQTFDAALRTKLRGIPAPPGLKRALLKREKVLRPPVEFWRRPILVAAAAIIVAFLGLALFWLRPSVPNRFVHFRETMVSAAVRMYGMDFETKDPEQLRQFFAGKGSPADYDLTAGLAKLQLKGGGLLRWRGNPVSMVCFDRGTGDTLFLFVLKRAAIKDALPLNPSEADLEQVDGLLTASWTRGDETYVLAGPNEPDFARKYLAAR